MWRVIFGCTVLIFIHILFIVPILSENTGNVKVIAVCSTILFFLLAGYFISFRKCSQQEWHILPGLAIPLGAVLTFFLNEELHLGAVVAASTVGLVGSFAPLLGKRCEAFPPAIYCGAFIGMSSVLIITSYWMLVMASLFSLGIYLLLQPVFNGFGGKLGSIAFGGVLCMMLLNYLV